MIQTATFDHCADPLAAMKAHYARLAAKSKPAPQPVPRERVSPFKAWETEAAKPVVTEITIHDIPWYWDDLDEMPVYRRVKAIKNRVADQYGVTVADIDGPRQFRRFMIPRFAAMSQVYQAVYGLDDWSLVRIGLSFGGRDHTTVLSALRRTGVWVRDAA